MTEYGLDTVPVRIVFFAAARELSGCSEVQINLSTPTTAKKLFSEVLSKHPELEKIEKSVMVAVNQEYIDEDTNQVSLRAGDEVAFIPPISGEFELTMSISKPTMANNKNGFTHVELTLSELSVAEVTRKLSSPSCGAISLFVGTTRDVFEGMAVVSLEYEAYNEMAEKEMKKLSDEARTLYPVENIIIIHRLGQVGVSEASIIVGVSSVHRAEAMAATTFIMDRIKARVPVWKKEVYSDGSKSWKENKECEWRSK